MDELHRRRQPQVVLALVAAEPRRREREQRPEPLAARLDQMRRHLRDARGVLARHPGADQRVHPLHVAGQRRLQLLQRIRCSGLSTSAVAVSSLRAMRELLRTNDPTVIAFSTALLRGEDIDCFVLDVHMSVLDGSIGILPRRIMVADRDLFRARAVLRDNEVDGVVPE